MAEGFASLLFPPSPSKSSGRAQGKTAPGFGRGASMGASLKRDYFAMPKVFMKFRMVSISEVTHDGNVSGPM